MKIKKFNETRSNIHTDVKFAVEDIIRIINDKDDSYFSTEIKIGMTKALLNYASEYYGVKFTDIDGINFEDMLGEFNDILEP